MIILGTQRHDDADQSYTVPDVIRAPTKLPRDIPRARLTHGESEEERLGRAVYRESCDMEVSGFFSRDCMGAILSPTARGQYPPGDVCSLFRVTYGRYAGVLRLGLYQPK